MNLQIATYSTFFKNKYRTKIASKTEKVNVIITLYLKQNLRPFGLKLQKSFLFASHFGRFGGNSFEIRLFIVDNIKTALWVFTVVP